LAKHQRRHHKAAAQPQSKPRRGLWIAGAAVVLAGIGAVVLYRAGVLGLAHGDAGGFNILLITADTTRADYLGCYGNTAAQTPNMDRLAREGTLFRHCSTSVVMTAPSHCTLMTGLYPFVHGVRRNGEGHLPAAATTLADVFKAAGYATAASVGAYVLDPRFGLAQGFDAYRGALPRAGSGDPGEAQRKGDKVCDDALEFLRGRAKQRFFLWAHFYDPHYPYESATHPDIGSAAAYADEITYMDTQIGRLLDELRKLGLEQNTLVVLVGDHGEGLDDHGEFQHAFFTYETCQRVPLLMRCPGAIPAGQQVAALVRTLDLAPTILELAGQSPLLAAQGVSLTPLLTGRSADLQLGAYCETTEPYTLLRLSRIRSYTVGRWKYIWSPNPQLFDLEADPGELNNVIGEHADTAASLHEQLRALIVDAPPRIPPDKSPPLTGDEIRRLESLGYIAPVGDAEVAEGIEADTFEPKEPDAHANAALVRAYEQARDALGNRRLAEAESQLLSILATLPNAPAPLRDLAMAYRNQRKLAEAGRTFERFLLANPNDTRTRGEYAGMLMELQQWGQAIVQATEILRVTPDDFTAQAMLGAAYDKLGRVDEACRHLEAAARLQPQYTAVVQMLGQVYLKQRRFGDAAECFRKVLVLQPRAADAQAGLEAAERELRK
jgi:arylsulfatase A-like enzyme/cytochrome c-type biogenesis protein CcmH/NrfG